MSERRFPIRMTIERSAEGFDPATLGPEKPRADVITGDVVLACALRHDGNVTNTVWASADGRIVGPASADDMFYAWMTLAKGLAEHDGLPQGARNTAALIVKSWEAVLSKKPIPTRQGYRSPQSSPRVRRGGGGWRPR